jgi:hypothetical protein
MCSTDSAIAVLPETNYSDSETFQNISHLLHINSRNLCTQKQSRIVEYLNECYNEVIIDRSIKSDYTKNLHSDFNLNFQNCLHFLFCCHVLLRFQMSEYHVLINGLIRL